MTIQQLIDEKSNSGLEPRFEYSVTPTANFCYCFRLVPDTHSPFDQTLIVHTLRKWLSDTLDPSTWWISESYINREFRFKNERDAVLFKMTWL